VPGDDREPGGTEPKEDLLTLVVRLVARKPELSAMIATILWKRLPSLSLEEIMAIAGIQLADLSETRAYQDILAKGREEGLEKGGQQEAAVLVLKQLRRRFGSVSADDAATIGGLSTAALEDLAEALLAFGSPVDLKAWLGNHRGD
jgi:predicted transposase YdaD